MTTKSMSVRLPEELAEKLKCLAKATQRTKSFCAVEAIKEYVQNQSWQIEAIEQGIKDAEEGRLVDHREVKKWVESWDSKEEKGLPK